MKKRKAKRVKGMTLIEVIIALLIFTLLTTIMVEVGSVTKSLLMNSNHVTNKTTVESPIGTVRDVSSLRDTVQDLGVEEDEAEALMDRTPLVVTVKSDSFSSTVNVTRYSTGAAALHATQNGRNCDTSGHLNADLQFYVIEEAEEPAEPEEP